jgi:hypothetical protein
MDIKQYSEHLTTLGTRYLTDGVRAWEAYTKAVGDALSGSGRTEDLQKRFTHIVLRDGPELARKLTLANLDYYKGLMDAGFSFGTQVFETTAKKSEPARRGAPRGKRKAKRAQS